MGETSAIEWTDATVNFWWGCTKVGPGCDHCYAEGMANRFGTSWGQGMPRRKIASAAKTLEKLNRQGGKWVFIQSMSDLFDNEVPGAWFDEAWMHIHNATNCRIQIVTKRVSRVEKAIAESGPPIWPAHAGLMITVVNQAEADRDIPRLLALKAKLGIPWVGLSMEPLLGPVDLTRVRFSDIATVDVLLGLDPETGRMGPCLDWVIVGGESGPKARPMHPDWARDIREQCQAAGVPFFFKQWGEWHPGDGIGEELDGRAFGCFNDAGRWVHPCSQDFANAGRAIMFRLGKTRAGRLLDRVEWNQFPGGL